MKYYLKALENYSNFQGRSSLNEYWYFFLFNFIFAVVSIILDHCFGTCYKNTDYNSNWNSVNSPYGIFYTVYGLAVIIPSLAVGVRRLHDINKSGWFLLIPVYNIILLAQKGDMVTNNYGFIPINEEGVKENKGYSIKKDSKSKESLVILNPV